MVKLEIATDGASNGAYSIELLYAFALLEAADEMISMGKESEVIDIVANNGPTSSFPCA